MFGDNGDGSSRSRSYSQSSQRGSELLGTQNQILQNRENVFYSDFLPMLKSTFADQSAGGAAFTAQMGKQAQEINAGFDAAQKATAQQLGKQNLSEDSGVAASLKAANERARESALASAYANTLSSANTNKINLLQTMAGVMPQPTTAAPVYTTSTGTTTSDEKHDNGYKW